MKNKLLKKLIIGTGSVSIGAGIVLSAPGIINSSQNKTRTNKDYSNGLFNFNEIAGMEDSTGNDILQDKDGNIWVGTKGQGLWKSTDGSTFTQITNGIKNNWAIYSLLQDKDGNIWVGTMANGLWKSTDGSTFTQVKFSDYLMSFFINSLLQDSDGNIWMATVSGLWKSTDGSTFTQITNEIQNNWFIESLMQDKDGNIWVGTRNIGLWKSTDGSTFTQITNGLEFYFQIFSLLQDNEGNIWVGTRNNGLWKSTDGSTFTQITNGIKNNWHIESLLQDKDGNIWVGTWEQGLWKSTDGSTFTQITNGIENDWLIYSLMQDKDGNIWVGTYEQGIWKRTFGVTFTPASTHNTIEEEGQTIYISDQSITLNIPPADQIIIDGEIISKTKEVTQYTFDGAESPHIIIITIAGQHYVILVYIVESSVIENGLNYSYYNPTTDELSIYMNQTIVEGIKLTYGGRPQGVDFLSFVEASNKWNDFKSNEELKNNLVNNLGMDWEMGFDLISSIDSQLTQSTGFISKDYTTAFINKINAMNPTDGISLKIEVDIDNGPAINNLGSPEINTDDMTTKYWDDILFNQIYKNGGL